MRMRHAIVRISAALGSVVLLASAGPPEVIVNGGFETGDLTGWTVVNQAGGQGDWRNQIGELSPISRTAVSNPPVGTYAAMADQSGGGAGSHVLYQDFVVPSHLAVAILGFQLYLNNHAPDFAVPDPPSLDFTGGPSQQVRVDLLRGGADPFSVSPDNVVVGLFETVQGRPSGPSYDAFNFDLTDRLRPLAGQMLRLRFAEVNNQGGLQFGVDGVFFSGSALPEPATIVLIAPAIAVGLVLVVRRGRRP